MTFEEGMKEIEREKYELLGIIQEKDKAIEELVEKKTALEKRCFELETENSKLEDINLKLCEQNNELIEENGTIKTQVSILQGKNKGLKELVKGYENTRDRMIAMGFPTFKSVKEYSAKLKELEKENERLHDFLTEAKPCECCKHYDEDLEKEDKEPCKNCFFDNSYWELKED